VEVMRRLLNLVALLMATQTLTVDAVVDDVIKSCPQPCSCYRQVPYSDHLLSVYIDPEID